MRALLIGTVLATVGCSGEPPILIGDDQIALVLTVAADGTLTHSGWIDGSAGARVAVPSGQRLFVFPLDHDTYELRGPGAWRSHLPTAVLADEQSCSVCLMTQGVRPQPVLPGESCPLLPGTNGHLVDPEGSGRDGDAADLAALRARVRLVWGTPLCPRVGRLGSPNGEYGVVYDQWLEGSGMPLRRLHASRDGAAGPLDAAVLDALDLLLLEWPVRTYTSTEARALATWIEGGGGLIVTSGFARDGSEPRRINGLLAPLGVEMVEPVRDGPIASFDEHPATLGVHFLDFKGGYGVAAEGTVIARTREGPVGVAMTRGAGRALVWGDEWILANFSFNESEDARTFWANAIVWAAVRRR